MLRAQAEGMRLTTTVRERVPYALWFLENARKRIAVCLLVLGLTAYYFRWSAWLFPLGAFLALADRRSRVIAWLLMPVSLLLFCIASRLPETTTGFQLVSVVVIGSAWVLTAVSLGTFLYTKPRTLISHKGSWMTKKESLWATWVMFSVIGAALLLLDQVARWAVLGDNYIVAVFGIASLSAAVAVNAGGGSLSMKSLLRRT
jgi:hypothetical protein